MQRLTCALLVALAAGCTKDTASDVTTATASAGDDSASIDDSASASDSGSASADDDDDGGSDDGSSGPAGSSDGADSSSGEVGECGAEGQCGAPAPIGWFGPAIFARVLDVAPPPDCPAAFGAAGPTVLEGWNDPGPAVCECECSLSADLACSSSVYSYSNASCSQGGYYSPVTTGCTNFDISGGVYFYSYVQNFPTCMQQSNDFLPPAQWDASIRSCKLEAEPTVACGDGGVCLPIVPEGFEPAMCIYADGDQACPPGAYSNKLSFFSNYEDTRACSSCSCGAAPSTCQPMQVYEQPDCEGLPVTEVMPNGSCTPATGASVAQAIDESSCPVTSAAEPMGAIAPIGPFTFCCA
jgi:hypothetical protein